MAIAITSLVFLLFSVVISIAVFKFGAHNLLRWQSGDKVGVMTWEDKGPVPLGDKGYTPQGLTWVPPHLIFANSWKDTRSRVYEIDPETMSIKRHFDMPDGAVHTSGLAWDGKLLWAVDYRSNRCYAIALEESLSRQDVKVVGSFDTTLAGTSACCLLPWNGETVLAISDFMNTRNTIFVRHHQALNSKTASGHIVFSYRNEGFSQGLEFFDEHLFESENRLGKNVINKMDLPLLREQQNSRAATVKQYLTSARGVEDLAWDGKALWTSDETVFRFFRGEFPEARVQIGLLSRSNDFK